MNKLKCKTKSRESTRSKWLADLPVGSLVSPRKLMYLTPITDDEVDDWPQWEVGQVGLVIAPIRGQIGVHVLSPRGSGLCFADEIYVHWDPTKDS